MKYFKDTYKYFFDKGPYLVLLAIVPSLLLPFLLSPSDALYALINYQDLTVGSFPDFYVQMHDLPFPFFWVGIIGSVLFIFVVAVMFGMIDRHMRVGEFSLSFNRAKTRLNYNIITSLKVVGAAVIVFGIVSVLTTTLYYLWLVAFGPGEIWLVFSLITFLLMSALLLYVMCIFLLWAPIMLHTGLNTRDALRMGMRQMSGKTGYAMLTTLVAILPFQLIMLITGILNCGVIVSVLLDGIAYAILTSIYVILMYNIFYDVTGTERMDLQSIDIWSKKMPK